MQAKKDRINKAKDAAKAQKDKQKQVSGKTGDKKKLAAEKILEEKDAENDSELSKLFPTLKTINHKKKRDEMFLEFDPNGNG